MEFVNPGFLYGLFALAVPVIIHLFNFRRFRKVYFSNVAFLQELKLETQKQSRLKHLLVLLLRMLAIAALVLAFSRPFIPDKNSLINPESLNFVSVYVDNSFSMQSGSEEGTLLDAAKARAAEIAEVYKTTDRFQLLTNDFEGWRQRFFTKEEFLEQVENIRISPVTRMLPEIISRQEDLLRQERTENRAAYLISDFQKSFFPEKIKPPDTLTGYFFVHLEALNAANLYIDSCWFDSPVQHFNQQSQLHVLFRNSSQTPLERIPVKLTINGMQKALASLDVEAGELKEVVLPYTNTETGIQFGKVEVPDYPINFDDELFFSYQVTEIIRILSINGEGINNYLNYLFSNDTGFVFRNVPAQLLDYSSFPDYNLIILNELPSIASGLRQEITRFVESGGSVVILPHKNIDLESYNLFLGETGEVSYAAAEDAGIRVSAINTQHPLYLDVFESLPENINLPDVFRYYPINIGTRLLHDKLLEMENGRVFLNLVPLGRGKIYVAAVPLSMEFSNFPGHSVFVPTFYKIAVSSITGQQLYHVIGQDEVLMLNNISLPGDRVVRIRSLEGGFEFIPGQRKTVADIELNMQGQIRNAGFYHVVAEGEPLMGLGFNYDRNESEMVFYDPEGLNTFMAEQGLTNFRVIESGKQPFAKTMRDITQGTQLWRWFVLGALLFLLGEVLLLRFWR